MPVPEPDLWIGIHTSRTVTRLPSLFGRKVPSVSLHYQNISLVGTEPSGEFGNGVVIVSKGRQFILNPLSTSKRISFVEPLRPVLQVQLSRYL